MAQCIDAKYKIGEISCPTKYFPEASSISLKNSAIYGLGCFGGLYAISIASMGDLEVCTIEIIIIIYL